MAPTVTVSLISGKTETLTVVVCGSPDCLGCQFFKVLCDAGGRHSAPSPKKKKEKRMVQEEISVPELLRLIHLLEQTGHL